LVFTLGLVNNNSYFWHSDKLWDRLGKHQAPGWHTWPLQLPSCRSCLAHTVDRFDNNRWFDWDQVLF